MENSADLGECYPPRPSASVDNTLLDLQNSSYPTQPHSIISKYGKVVTGKYQRSDWLFLGWDFALPTVSIVILVLFCFRVPYNKLLTNLACSILTGRPVRTSRVRPLLSVIKMLILCG